MSLKHFELNPFYGTGVYRRLLRFVRETDAVGVLLDDTHHAMWAILRHKQGVATGVEAEIVRGPATSCGGAAANLLAIVGTHLHATPAEVSARLPGPSNCTHLSDLVRWALEAAHRPAEFRAAYEIIVPDRCGDAIWIEILGDGVSLHRWLIDEHQILAPQTLASVPLFNGFLGQARQRLDPSGLRSAVMLQRGAWVARGRRYLVDQETWPLSAAVGMKDACFSYSSENWTTATNVLGYVRDFTTEVMRQPLPEQLKEMIDE